MDSPFELLRQWIGHGGWYDQRSRAFQSLVGVHFVAAVTQRKGEALRLPVRMTKLFHLLYQDALSFETIGHIFSTIVNSAPVACASRVDVPEFCVLTRDSTGGGPGYVCTQTDRRNSGRDAVAGVPSTADTRHCALLVRAGGRRTGVSGPHHWPPSYPTVFVFRIVFCCRD
jgi:hypothetical protein